MKTSCFHSYSGPGRVSIARYAPRNTPPGFRIMKGLAPGSWFNSVSEEQYNELFASEILAPLDPQETWATLHKMAAGAEPVLLCWEKPADLASGKTYCHRRIVAAWFKERLGHDVPEMTAAEAAAFPPAASGPAHLTCATHGIKLITCGDGYFCPKCPTPSARSLF